MISGFPIVSSQPFERVSRLSRISIVAESIFALSSNSRMTSDTFSCDVELTVFMLFIVDMDCSTGLVTVCSTSSGLAPTYVVITIA